jgi:hypothetical protein
VTGANGAFGMPPDFRAEFLVLLRKSNSLGYGINEVVRRKIHYKIKQRKELKKNEEAGNDVLRFGDGYCVNRHDVTTVKLICATMAKL